MLYAPVNGKSSGVLLLTQPSTLAAREETRVYLKIQNSPCTASISVT